MPDKMQQRLDKAIEWTKEAEDLILTYYFQGFDIELKDNKTFVTEADRQAEKLLRERIAKEFPDDGIIGEEFPELNKEGDFTWTIDPIDGTSSFVHQVPLFGCMLGVMRNHEPLMGVIRFPATNEFIFAVKGQGAVFNRGNDRELHDARVRSCEDPKGAWFSHSGNEYFVRAGLQDKLDKLRSSFPVERGWGDCYGYYLLATGRIDIMTDAVLGLWDIVPIRVICEEAGADWFGYDGKRGMDQQGAIACHPDLSEHIFKTLNINPA